MGGDSYFGNKAAILKDSVPQYGYGSVDLAMTFVPATYEVRIRTYGDPDNVAKLGFYYEDNEGAHHLIALINSRADGKFHTDSFVITPSKPFNKFVLKKVESLATGCNPVDRFVVVSDYRIEGEATTHCNFQICFINGASSGQAAGLTETVPLYGFGTIDLGRAISPGNYKLSLRFYGNPSNAARQGIYYSDTSGIHHYLGFEAGRTDGEFYTLTYTFTNSEVFEKIVIKKAQDSNQGTNPVDFIALENN